MEFNSNAIEVKNISVQNNSIVQAFAFDFGKVLSHDESTFTRFVHVIEGNAKVVIDGNSNFMPSGDFILIPAHTSNSIEANHRFKMICTTIQNQRTL